MDDRRINNRKGLGDSKYAPKKKVCLCHFDLALFPYQMKLTMTSRRVQIIVTLLPLANSKPPCPSLTKADHESTKILDRLDRISEILEDRLGGGDTSTVQARAASAFKIELEKVESAHKQMTGLLGSQVEKYFSNLSEKLIASFELKLAETLTAQKDQLEALTSPIEELMNTVVSDLNAGIKKFEESFAKRCRAIHDRCQPSNHAASVIAPSCEGSLEQATKTSNKLTQLLKTCIDNTDNIRALYQRQEKLHNEVSQQYSQSEQHAAHRGNPQQFGAQLLGSIDAMNLKAMSQQPPTPMSIRDSDHVMITVSVRYSGGPRLESHLLRI